MGRTILITGAASGIGLEFLLHYSKKEPTNQIYGIDLHPLSEEHAQENIQFFQVDVTSEASLRQASSKIDGRPINLLIHSAGIRGLVPEREQRHHGDIDACETMEAMTPDTMQKTLAVNSVGTFNTLRTFLPNLRNGSGSKVIIISSRMGSIAQNTAGSAYAYRASKAAQNAVVKSFSIDVPEISFILCHPGRVETKLVKWKEEGAISAKDSVDSLLPLIEKWGQNDSGKFFDRFGGPIQW